MFLYEGDCLKNITEIRGIRYVTVSHYSGDTVIQNKMAELIKRDFHPSELNNHALEFRPFKVGSAPPIVAIVIDDLYAVLFAVLR